MFALSNKTSNRLKYISIIGFLFIAFVGCNGTSGTASLLKGVFVDSPVQGLHYETETQTGTTDKNGTFNYIAGETITFYIGDKLLGSADAQTTMTLIHMVNGAKDETDPAVTNMGMFIQTLDEDGNLDNGITITPEVSDVVSSHETIDFYLNTSDFQDQEDITRMFDTMNETGLFPGGNREMISPDAAQKHMKQYMMPHMGSTSDDNNSTGHDNSSAGHDNNSTGHDNSSTGHDNSSTGHDDSSSSYAHSGSH